jgi:hypothetical protein
MLSTTAWQKKPFRCSLSCRPTAAGRRMVKSDDFDPSVPLPTGLDVSAIRRAIGYVEKELTDLVELYFEQANVFSGLVGMFGTKALSQYSQFEKNKHPDIAAQRFPDLCRRGRVGRLRPADCLESKGSKRPFAIQFTSTIPAGTLFGATSLTRFNRSRPGSRSLSGVSMSYSFRRKTGNTRAAQRALLGGRTHTFGVKQPAKKLKGTAVYKRKDIVVKGNKPVPINGH